MMKRRDCRLSSIAVRAEGNHGVYATACTPTSLKWELNDMKELLQWLRSYAPTCFFTGLLNVTALKSLLSLSDFGSFTARRIILVDLILHKANTKRKNFS